MNRLIALFTVALAGCGIVSTEWEHTSHPFAGPPFGPQTEEGWLDTLNLIHRYESNSFYTEIGFGYKLSDGLYGPDLTCTSRVGVKLWGKK